MTNEPAPSEACPRCGLIDRLRPKLLLIDEAWEQTPGRDPREKYFSDLRVDEVREEARGNGAFKQFVEGFYCDRCARAFVPDAMLADGTWRARPKQ